MNLLDVLAGAVACGVLVLFVRNATDTVALVRGQHRRTGQARVSMCCGPAVARQQEIDAIGAAGFVGGDAEDLRRTAPEFPGLHAGREPLVNPITINTKEVRK